MNQIRKTNHSQNTKQQNNNSILENTVSFLKKDNQFGISGATIKWIAIITMFIDHVGASVFWQYTAANHYSQNLLQIYHILRYIGRVSFPLFIFLLVEGFTHTKNKWSYLLRMLLFAVISEIPFDLAFFRKVFYLDRQNVYFTLFLGLFAILLMDLIDKKWSGTQTSHVVLKSYIKFVVIIGANVCAYFLKTDYDISGVSAIIIMYCVRTYLAVPFMLRYGAPEDLPYALRQNTRKKKSTKTLPERTHVLRILDMIAMGMTCIILLTSSLSEAFGLINLPLVYSYNGKRGKQMKYFFYLFYPVHLFLLWVVMKLMRLA